MAKLAINKEKTVNANIESYKEAIKKTETRQDLFDIVDDDNLSIFNENEKKEIIDFSIDIFLERYKIAPTDYKTLKQEVKLFSTVTQISFIFLAERLKTIRGNQLYLKDNYKDFNSFIINELPISKRTVYNYIDLLDIFGVQTFALDNDLNYSKLIPAIPILKADIGEIDKQDLKNKLLIDIKNKSAREMQKEINDLKKEFNLSKTTKETGIKQLCNKFLSDINKIDLTENDKEFLSDFTYRLKDVVNSLKNKV